MGLVMNATAVEILPTAIWIESSALTGSKRVMLQHQGCDPFAYATFCYDYRYTSNATVWRAAVRLAVALGATEPVEERTESLPQVSAEECAAWINEISAPAVHAERERCARLCEELMLADVIGTGGPYDNALTNAAAKIRAAPTHPTTRSE